MLLVLNLPLIGLWVRLLTIPYKFLFNAILIFCAIGTYSVSNSATDIWLLLVFTAVGYVFLKLHCEPAPLILGFILGPMMEENLRRALRISLGDPSVLVTRPLSAAFLAISLALLVMMVAPSIRAKREVALQE
jgi:putative tricarboxylic transport membrane protein